MMNIMALIQQLMGGAGASGDGLGGGMRKPFAENPLDMATGGRTRFGRPPLEQGFGAPSMNTVAGPQYDQNDVAAGAPVIPGNNPIVRSEAPQSSMDMMTLMHQLAQRGRFFGGGSRGFREGPYQTPPTQNIPGA